MKSFTIRVFCCIICFFMLQSTASAFRPGNPYTLSGKTMGTYYTVKFISNREESESSWKSRVDTRLKEVNKKLSMYDPNSEISLFNRLETGQYVTASSDFHRVVSTGKKLYEITDGAWDGTVKPLVDLWGFGTQNAENKIPDPAGIALALSKVGFNHIEITDKESLCRKKDVTLDLGSIAKGYGVDAVAALLSAAGIQDLLVEIGGELSARGRNKKGDLWSVGISRPDKQFANMELYKIVRLNNMAIATSGNYRNFFEINGKTFSHIIDPKTGFPVDNQIVSASVISGNCTFADGLATALMVMDIQKGISLVNRLENTECLIIQNKDGVLISHVSEKFEDFVEK